MHVGQVVARGSEFLGVGVADITQWIEAVGDQDGGREIGVRLRVQRRDVGVADVVGVRDGLPATFRRCRSTPGRALSGFRSQPVCRRETLPLGTVGPGGRVRYRS